MEIYLSKKGKKLLEEKLELIEKEIVDTYKRMGESAKVDNDLRENPEYNELQTKVSYALPLEKSKIREMLNNSLIIEEQEFYKNFNGKEVVIGSKVKILYNNIEEEYSIVGQGEDDPMSNIISYSCDFAKNLVGKMKNDKFKYKNAEIIILDIVLN